MNPDICSNKSALAQAWLFKSLLICFVLVLSVSLIAVAQEQPKNESNKVDQTNSGSEADVSDIFRSNKKSSLSTLGSAKSEDSSTEEPTLSTLDSILQSSGSPSQGPKLGLLDIEEYIAKNRFIKTPNLQERAVLVRVYERIAIALCFPTLNALINGETAIKQDNNCNDALDKLAKIHSNNTILICAKNGVDSLECARSYQEQMVRKYQDGEYAKLSLTSTTKKPLDSPEVNEKFKSLQKKLFADIDAFKSQFSVTNLKNLDASLYKVLAIVCSNDALELSEKPAQKSTNSFADILKNDPSLYSQIEGLRSTKPEPTATPKLETKNDQQLAVYYRTRILPDSCYDSIVDASTIDNRIASSICFKEGFLSPSCLSALRRLKSLKDPNAPEQKNQKPAKDGLASF